MRHGLCGAHRVGKSTTARTLAEQLGIPYLETHTAAVLASIGMNAKDQYTVYQRMYGQELILDHLCAQWESLPDFVTDRTPYDLMAYMEAEVLRDFSDELLPRYNAYRTKCMKAMKNFEYIVLIQPGIELVDDAKSAPTNSAYIEHLNNLMIAYSVQNNTHVLPRFMTDLDARINFLKNIDKARKPYK